MKKWTKAAAVLCAGAMLVGSLAGCGRKNITLADYPNTTVATFGDTRVSLAEANYQARSAQYTTEYYYTMFGYAAEDIWTGSMGEQTMEEYTKTQVMQQIYQTLVLKAKAEELGLSLTEDEKAKCAETAQGWIDTMDASVAAVVNPDLDMLTAMCEDNALAMKAYQEAIKDVDTNVSDEEARQRRVNYYRIKEDDNNDAETAKALAEELLTEVQAGAEISSDTADLYDNVINSSTSFGEGDLNNVIEELGLTLATGESGSIYDESAATWYVLYCESDFDEDATATKKKSIISDREDELFATVYAEWAAAAPEFKVDEKIWNFVKFDKTLYEAAETEAAETEAAETEAETEAAEETSASQ